MTSLPLIAVVGNPNAGKSALFNKLTGARQKVGNYPGVTVERKSGRLSLPDGRPAEIVDLPGAYSLEASSPDEEVTRDVVLGKQQGERLPDLLLLVVDATNLDNHLRFALQIIDLGLPTVVALNMIDLARREGLTIDPAVLERELGVPVIETIAVRRHGMDELKEAISSGLGAARRIRDGGQEDFSAVQRRARSIAAAATVAETARRRWTHRLDSIALHPLLGPLIFVAIMFVMFQAVFAWAQPPAEFIDARFTDAKAVVTATLAPGLLRSMLVDGIITGVGAVVVFLPQILILFLFILLLESTGYMVRAAFLIDRLMARVGLSGHAFIPLLSSFACAVPGIMATRTIEDPKHRLTTILIAPLMTCSARLPVYAIIIGAFIPARGIGAGIGLQGLVMLGLYLTGIVGALVAALVLRRTVAKGTHQGFMLEMPKYQMPHVRDIALGLWQRAMIFLKRAGTIILVSTIVLWALLSFPQARPGESQLDVSIAGKMASGLEVVMRPIGFNHEISLALIPAMAAREVAVSALATAYSIDESDENKAQQSLTAQLQGRWSLPTALAFLAWFIFAPQCLSTIAVARRETAGWRWPIFMVLYLFSLAYIAAGTTFWLATWTGL